MPLYVFLGRGRTSFLTGVQWPEPENGAPGAWVDTAGAVRAYETDDLPWALDDELWEIEVAGDIQRVRTSVHADRGRLIRRVEAWTPAVAEELAAACEARLREQAAEAARGSGGERQAELLNAFAGDLAGYAGDAEGARAAGVAAYVAAHAVAGADKAAPGYERRFALERQWQAEWLRSRLSL